MAEIRIEYLITFDSQDVFCKDIAAFNNLLQSIDGLSTNGNVLTYEQLSLDYEVKTGEISFGKQRFFHVRLSCRDESELSDFEDLVRSIRTILAKAGGRPAHVLWDGVSFLYAQKAYPLIYGIENTMRKLITKFMLINIGLGWTSETIPKEVIDSIRTGSKKSNQNYLYDVDFIQLSNFLFNEYSTLNPNMLVDKIREAKTIEDLSITELREAIPQSNWERYFSELVPCDSDYLRIRWERLYERRNQIAHTKSISRTDYDDIITLINDLEPKLQAAIDNLDKITVPTEEKESVAVNVVSAKSFEYEEFMRTWSVVQHVLSKLIYYYAEKRPEDTSGSDIESIPVSRNNIRRQLGVLARKGYISRELRKEVMGLQTFRNVLVDRPDYTFSEESIQKANISLQNCLELLLLKMQEISPFSSINDGFQNEPPFDPGNGADGDLMDVAGNDSTT